MRTHKIQITLTPQEVAALSTKSKALGYNVTKYIKFIVSKEAQAIVEHYPIYMMNKKLESITLKALKDHQEGKTKLLESPDELDNL